MALSPNALTTVERLCGYLGIAVPTNPSVEYTQYEAIINSVSRFVTRYTGINFGQQVYIELPSTERGDTIVLGHSPISESESFSIERRSNQLNEDSWETVDGNLYTVDYAAGIIYGMGGHLFARSRSGYRITYTSGYDFDNTTTFLGDTDAADVEMAVWLMCQDFKNNTSTNATVKSERVGDYAVTYADNAGNSSMFNNPTALAILDGYAGFGGGGVGAMGVLTPLQS